MEKWAYNKIIKYLNLLKLRKTTIDIKKEIKITVFYSFLIGAFATIPIVLSEIYFIGNDFSLKNLDVLNIIIYIFILIVSVILEFYFLYIIGFKIISKIIFVENKLLKIKINEDTFFQTLARSSIEYPEPNKNLYGINTSKYKSKNKFLITFIYKIKIMLSNFILKLIIKKLLSRGAFRGLASFVAIPVTGLWDAFIVSKIIKEVKFKIKTNIKILKLLEIERKNIEEELKILSFRILLYGEYNYNLEYLLNEMIYKNNGNFKFIEDEVENYFNINFVKKENINFVIEIFSFKQKKLNKREIEFLEYNNILRETIKKQKDLKNESKR